MLSLGLPSLPIPVHAESVGGKHGESGVIRHELLKEI